MYAHAMNLENLVADIASWKFLKFVNVIIVMMVIVMIYVNLIVVVVFAFVC